MRNKKMLVNFNGLSFTMRVLPVTSDIKLRNSGLNQELNLPMENSFLLGVMCHIYVSIQCIKTKIRKREVGILQTLISVIKSLNQLLIYPETW